MRTVIQCAQRSPEWHAARVGIATASRFEEIMKVRQRGGNGELQCRADYRAELAVERLTGISLEKFVSEDMENGTIREPMARAAYAVATGEFVSQIGFVRLEFPECGGSPDGLVGSDGIVEFKCPKIATHRDYLLDQNAPQKYIAQMQGNIMFNEREWCDFASFHPDYPEHLRLAIRRVWRDDKYIAGLQLALQIFMEEVRSEEQILRNHIEVLP